ncbi:MAG: tRNA (guanosine(46)-N7)-methyltransferase TrmB [Clostridiales bacterium]|nr:tRNA (guanosine(46)-N7)-methyltransferase TrmB [Clostridiales bacterium]
MRMRKKRHLTERLADCTELIVPIEYGDKRFDASFGDEFLLDLKEIFGNDNPVEMEIGSGKGGFICEAAKRRPDINFLAVEKSSNVLVTACENVFKEGIQNIRFIKLTAEYLQRYIPERSVEKIYLNFSCPYPKNSYADHRLTSDRFIKIYKVILKENGEIYQKTDDMKLFEFSIEKFSQNGFKFKNISLDLHNSDFEGNIETEYEKKFVEMGKPIYRLEAYI